MITNQPAELCASESENPARHGGAIPSRVAAGFVFKYTLSGFNELRTQFASSNVPRIATATLASHLDPVKSLIFFYYTQNTTQMKRKSQPHLPPSVIESKIHEVRGLKVMLDMDLAELYGVETKRLKEAVRRNKERFPADFMFVIKPNEFEDLRSQIATSKKGGVRYMPYAFTEQGVAMLSAVLNSRRAVNVNIQIIRAFVLLRQYALSHRELSGKLRQLEDRYDKQFRNVYEAISFLVEKDRKSETQQKRKRIGYRTAQTRVSLVSEHAQHKSKAGLRAKK
jgi:hypothetical protein